ncbi:MAG TPA: hypothetical protein VF813_05120 [Anaerolineaceae bacterium]
MPGVIDPETMHVDELPGVWAPVQWEQTPEDRLKEDTEQARGSLLASVDVPEAILRLLLNEADCDVVYAPPDGYNSDEQGDWDETLVTYAFNRQMRLRRVERTPDRLVVEYQFENFGWWQFVIEPERVTIERI